MSWWRCLATVFVVVGIILSPLRATAATSPMLIAYDAAVLPTTTTALAEEDAVRRKPSLERF